MTEKHYTSNSLKTFSVPDDIFTSLMEDVLVQGKPFKFKATGTSMTPFIKNGETITISPVTGNLTVGDVGVYKDVQNKRVLIHRVTHVLPSGYVFKGDAFHNSDGFVAKTQVVGIVSSIGCNQRSFHFRNLIPKRIMALCSELGLIALYNRFARLLRRIMVKHEQIHN